MTHQWADLSAPGFDLDWCRVCGTLRCNGKYYIPGHNAIPNSQVCIESYCTCVDRQTRASMQDARDRCISEQARIIAELRATK